LMDFFRSHQTVASLLSYLLPFSRTFNCTSKTTGSRVLLIPTCPTLTKCYSETRILIYIDFFQSHKLWPTVYLTFFHFPNVQLH
jgi:hypothetical protein